MKDYDSRRGPAPLMKPKLLCPWKRTLLSTEHDTRGKSRTCRIWKTEKSLALITGIQTQDWPSHSLLTDHYPGTASVYYV